MQGIGNDYVYVNCFKEKVEDPGEAAIKVSDRHFGIGSDGMILIKPSEVADFQMDMYNADGSRGAMCGNGIRCVAKYVYDYGLTDKTSVSVETASGIKYLDLTVENGKVVLVKVNMGAPILEAAKIPVVSEKEQVINEPLLVDGKEYRITGVSMGNPHAITYIDDVKGLDIEKIGPKFEFHPAFPDRVNTEFARVLDDHTVEMRVWERGSGETLACVSYPGYDNNRLANTMDSAYYNQLNTGRANIFYNRATQEKTAPGSTFKMISATAGLEEGYIDAYTTTYCSGSFNTVTPSPKCWIYPGGHGALNVVQSLQHSCNVFYYQLGYNMGIDSNGNYDSDLGTDKLRKYAAMYGLDRKSGVEIPEAAPQISDEYSIQSAIGQGTNNFTVSQLNRYVTAVANSGTVYDLTLIDKTTDAAGNLIKDYSAEVDSTMDEINSSTWDLIHQGMEQMVASSTTFTGLDFSMAGKTGTAQHNELHADHVLFVGYAPAEQPQLSIAVRITYGYNSGYASEIGRDIAKVYFNPETAGELITGSAANLGEGIAGD